jgi:hypothetical protein
MVSIRFFLIEREREAKKTNNGVSRPLKIFERKMGKIRKRGYNKQTER